MGQHSAVAAVIFDWGGTLTDDLLANLELIDVWQATARRLDPANEAALTDALAAAEVRFWERTATTQESGTLTDLLRDASHAVGLDVTEALLEEAVSHHLDTWTPHIRHDAEAAATLEALRSRGIRTGLLSNTHWPRAFHERFLERDGLADLLDARLYSSELSHMKPHPSVFEAALAAVGIDDPGSAVFVGDRPFDDIYGAKGAGLRAVLRPNHRVPDYDVEPDAVIHRLPELLELVDAWSDD